MGTTLPTATASCETFCRRRVGGGHPLPLAGRVLRVRFARSDRRERHDQIPRSPCWLEYLEAQRLGYDGQRRGVGRSCERPVRAKCSPPQLWSDRSGGELERRVGLV